jgi:hypothetical protein
MSYNTQCKKCNDPKPIITVFEISPGKWGIKNLNGSAHAHNTGYPQNTQEEKMQEAYPNTAPKIASTYRTAISDSHRAEQKTLQAQRTDEIKKAHDENIQATKDKIAALDRNTSACNRVADAINRYCDIKQGIVKAVEGGWTDKGVTKEFSLHLDDNVPYLPADDDDDDEDHPSREQRETEP